MQDIPNLPAFREALSALVAEETRVLTLVPSGSRAIDVLKSEDVVELARLYENIRLLLLPVAKQCAEEEKAVAHSAGEPSTTPIALFDLFPASFLYLAFTKYVLGVGRQVQEVRLADTLGMSAGEGSGGFQAFLRRAAEQGNLTVISSNGDVQHNAVGLENLMGEILAESTPAPSEEPVITDKDFHPEDDQPQFEPAIPNNDHIRNDDALDILAPVQTIPAVDSGADTSGFTGTDTDYGSSGGDFGGSDSGGGDSGGSDGGSDGGGDGGGD